MMIPLYPCSIIVILTLYVAGAQLHMACRLRRAWHGFCTIAQMGAEAWVAEQPR